MRRGPGAALALSLAWPAAAVDVVLPPGAERTLARAEALEGYAVATAPFDGRTVPTEAVEGALTRQAWRVDGWTGSTLALLAPVRDRLVAEGWAPLLDCEARGCGGFDFRFALDVAPAPAMFVDLADYRYLSAARDGARLDLLASRSGDVAYLQATVVVPAEARAAPGAAVAEPLVARRSASDAPRRPEPEGEGALAGALDARGRAVLADLAFPTGSAALPDGDYPSLAALAAWMRDHPDATVALVGHTDAAGGTAANLALSRRRAEAARALLLARHGIDGDRVETRGVAYFAPVATNDTAEGRAANRRVEAVVTTVR